jgi:hypothetical protein
MVHKMDRKKKMDEAKSITPSDFTKKVLKEYAKDTGKKYDELLKLYNDFREVLDKSGDTEEFCDERARSQVRVNIRAELASPAAVFRGVALAVAEPFDTIGAQWANATALFKNNETRQQAIDQGIITPDGMPIDRRKVFSTGRANRGFGKPYPAHSYVRNVFGVYSTQKGEPLPAKITLSRSQALGQVPLYVPTQVRLNNATPKEVTDELLLTSSSVTEFKQIEDPDIPHPEDLMQMYCAKYFTTIANLQKVHDSFITNPADVKAGQKPKLNPNRLTLLDVYLLYLDTEPNAQTGNYRMVVEDDSISLKADDDKRRGTVIWLPEHLYPLVANAGKGTRLHVLGQTMQPQTRLDFTTGKTINEPGDVGMNATGILPRRGWFIEKAEESPAGEDVS